MSTLKRDEREAEARKRGWHSFGYCAGGHGAADCGHLTGIPPGIIEGEATRRDVPYEWDEVDVDPRVSIENQCEPTPTDLIHELSAAMGIDTGASPYSPKEVWEELLDQIQGVFAPSEGRTSGAWMISPHGPYVGGSDDIDWEAHANRLRALYPADFDVEIKPRKTRKWWFNRTSQPDEILIF